MNAIRTTTAGTAIYEPSREEFDSILEAKARRLTGLSADEFLEAFRAGRIDGSNPAVSELAALLSNYRRI